MLHALAKEECQRGAACVKAVSKLEVPSIWDARYIARNLCPGIERFVLVSRMKVDERAKLEKTPSFEWSVELLFAGCL